VTRTYRLAAPDRTGVLLGLTTTQVGLIAVGVTAGVVTLAVHGPLLAALAVIVAASAASFATADGQLLVDWARPALAWLIGRGGRSWHAPIPLVAGARPPWPPTFEGPRVVAVTTDGTPAPPEVDGTAVVFDHSTGRAGITMAVTGKNLVVDDPADQDARLAGWGDALAGFCQDNAPVVAIRWAEWQAPAGFDRHRRYLDATDPDPAFDGAYRKLLADNHQLIVGHQVLVTITVDVRRAGGTDHAVAQVLLAQAQLFAARLEQAELTASTPLTTRQLATAVRVRLEPGRPGPGATLGSAAGLIPANWGPLATEASWSWWRTDAWYHRGLYVADWPRAEVDATWLSGLLLAAPHIVRTVAVFYEPVAPRSSRRRIERDATKLDSDEEHRHRSGFRVGAEHYAARQGVAARDAELTAGYRELTYAGVVTVSAADPTTLDRHTAEVIQAAGGIGVDLRPLHGRHDQAGGAAIPLTRGLNPVPTR
jgi:hypothetical protein